MTTAVFVVAQIPFGAVVPALAGIVVLAFVAVFLDVIVVLTAATVFLAGIAVSVGALSAAVVTGLAADG